LNRIILASSSPRREYLLNMILSNFGLKFDIIPANIREYIPQNGAKYSLLVKKLALMKARKISGEHKGIIIGADTIVVLKGKIMGKPGSNKDAVRMLRTLSGNEHKVYTGIAIINTLTGGIFIDYEMTKVKFRRLEKDEINFYVRTNSPMDKAGAYGIQDDFGSTFVEKITGDYFNVVGLPVVKTYLGLKKIMNITL
jgi:nucleoside triphosphate pyrophosphatase